MRLGAFDGIEKVPRRVCMWLGRRIYSSRFSWHRKMRNTNKSVITSHRREIFGTTAAAHTREEPRRALSGLAYHPRALSISELTLTQSRFLLILTFVFHSPSLTPPSPSAAAIAAIIYHYQSNRQVLNPSSSNIYARIERKWNYEVGEKWEIFPSFHDPRATQRDFPIVAVVPAGFWLCV